MMRAVDLFDILCELWAVLIRRSTITVIDSGIELTAVHSERPLSDEEGGSGRSARVRVLGKQAHRSPSSLDLPCLSLILNHLPSYCIDT
jgi:hypothetical protein